MMQRAFFVDGGSSVLFALILSSNDLNKNFIYYYMNCDIELHEGLIELGDIVCPFCNNELGPKIKFLIFIFLHFRVQLDLLTHLAKFQSITNIRSHFILTFISENLRPPLINLVPRLGCEWEKVTSKTQTYLTG